MWDVLLKNGSSLSIRPGTAEDAEAALEYLDKIASESPFLSFGPGEMQLTMEEEVEFLESFRGHDNKVLLMGWVNDELVCSATLLGRTRPRMRHVAELGISVTQKWWGQGVGRAMIQALLDWAGEQGVLKRIFLVTREDNKRGIALYESMGFEYEARLKRETLLDGQFYDSFLYALLLE
jgi:RimJ/RimL family protein N-acetyltransferase